MQTRRDFFKLTTLATLSVSAGVCAKENVKVIMSCNYRVDSDDWVIRARARKGNTEYYVDTYCDIAPCDWDDRMWTAHIKTFEQSFRKAGLDVSIQKPTQGEQHGI